jgi:hypothetical protein
MRNVSDKALAENQNTHFMFNLLFSEDRAIYEIMLKNMLAPDKPRMTIQRMRTGCWIHKAIDTYSEYVILIAFPLRRLQERP